jgi:hemoglobin-like flavoprotein
VDLKNLDHMRQSFPVMFQHKGKIARKFYHNLFRDAPETREMFGHNMGAQREMLATVLTTLAKASFEPATVQQILARLARSHAGLGLTKKQFEVGEVALKTAINSTMEGKVSAEVLSAWQVAVRRVVEAMQNPPDS